MKKTLLPVLLIIVSLFSNTLIKAEEVEEPSNLYAQSAVLMDADSGRILFEKNGQEKKPMASTTKIMTLIVILENTPLDELLCVSSNAARQPDVQLNINTGEYYYVKDLLYSLMLESHNDSAYALAEHVGGSVEGFAKLMNQKAGEIGCENTYYVTPNGLDGEDEGGEHSTTAAELAKVMRYCIRLSPKREEFLEITRTQSYSFTNMIKKEDGSVSKGSRSFTCNNHNAFLSMMEGALSGKTGFTGKAGYCYVGALERDGKTFIVALLACGWPNNKTYKWSDTKKLMNYGLENYEYKNVWTDKQFDPITVKEGIPKSGNLQDCASVPVIISENGEEKELRVLLRKDEKVTVKAKVSSSLEAPVKKGTEVGTVQYYLNGDPIYEVPIITAEDRERISYPWCLNRVLEYFLL